jgi:hypothetical protein
MRTYFSQHVCTMSHHLRFMLLDLHIYTSYYAPLRSRAIRRLVLIFYSGRCQRRPSDRSGGGEF